LNNALWITEHAHPVVRAAFPSLTLPSGPGAHGCYGSNADWTTAADEQRLWVRQHVLVSAASLLEVYFATAMPAALWSRPEYADRSLTGVREIELIKFENRAPHLRGLIQSHAKLILKGAWSSRFRCMAVVFGPLPPKLEALSTQLQDIQGKRNQIAHSFGQAGRSLRRTPWEPSDSIKLDVTDVEGALICVSQAIREADMHLFAGLIGGYEFLYEYHIWLKAQTGQVRITDPDVLERNFRRHIAQKFGSGPSKKYYQALIWYYETCN
jgi:hypothetical protein